MSALDSGTLTRETLDKAFDQLLNPDWALKAEQARRDEALARWLTEDPQGSKEEK